MSRPRGVLPHLLEGREQLVREVERLTSAIADLDALIDKVGGPGAREGLSMPVLLPVGSGRRRGAHKPIRVHVLDILGAEDRDFELGEIIDRIHDEGIAAHDDAVRSITVKLMKDGEVERVGRGQYRLARRPASGDEAQPEPAGTGPSLNLAQPWPQPAT